jgi:hypothetical protein
MAREERNVIGYMVGLISESTFAYSYQAIIKQK